MDLPVGRTQDESGSASFGIRFRGFSRPAVFGALGQVPIIGIDFEHLLFEDRIGHALRHRARFLRTVAPVLWII
jgi:hypothetical protein